MRSALIKVGVVLQERVRVRVRVGVRVRVRLRVRVRYRERVKDFSRALVSFYRMLSGL